MSQCRVGCEHQPIKDGVRFRVKKTTVEDVGNCDVSHADAEWNIGNGVAASSPVKNVQSQISLHADRIKKLLQDRRYKWKSFFGLEDKRSFDEEVDLDIRHDQQVQVIAWIRFHRNYHARKMHIRTLISKTGATILVMDPNEIIAADKTTDIRDVKDQSNVPYLIKELLDPSVSPSNSGRYVLMLSDGIKWELLGLIFIKAPVFKEMQVLTGALIPPVHPMVAPLESEVRTLQQEQDFSLKTRRDINCNPHSANITQSLVDRCKLDNDSSEWNLSSTSDSVRSYMNCERTNYNVGNNAGRNSAQTSTVMSPESFRSDSSDSIPILATVCSVQLSSGRSHRCLKVTLDSGVSMTSQKRSILLPLLNSDDQWSLVSVAEAPHDGLPIPGVPVSIPYAVLHNVCRAAVAFTQCVVFPLHVVGPHEYSILKVKEFGVFSSPHLRNHIFLGPFPRRYLEEHPVTLPCMRVLHITTVSLPACSNSSSTSECESSAEASASVLYDTMEVDSISGSASSEDNIDEETKNSVSSQQLEEWIDSEDSEIMDEPLPDEISFQCASVSPLLSPVVTEESPTSLSYVSSEPKQTFMAYAKGLPATTVAVYTDRVIVRHPIHPTRHFKFDSIAQAKHWLQSLTVFKGCRQLPYAGDVTNVSETESEDSVEESPKPKRFKRTASGRKSRSSSGLGALPLNTPLPSLTNRKRVTFQLHTDECERGEEVGRLIKELELLIYPKSCILSEDTVLERAKAECEYLTREQQEMTAVYNKLVKQRLSLTRFGELVLSLGVPISFQQSFKSLISLPLPNRHKKL